MIKNKITLNVLADITKKIGSVSIRGNDNSKNPYGRDDMAEIKDKVLVVFTGSDINIEEKIKDLLELKDRGIHLSLVFSRMGEAILDLNKIKERLKPERVYLEEDILELKKISKQYNYIISPNITLDTMSKVNGSLLDGFIPNLIWTFLYMGKEVYVDFQSTLNYMGMDCKNKNIEKRILRSIEDIKSLGVTELASKKYIETIYNDKNLYKDRGYISKVTLPARRQDKTESDAVRSKQENSGSRKIYTQNDIENSLSRGDTLVLRGGSILTPLAKDKIRSKGINIKFE